jgi:hypothetical protein
MRALIGCFDNDVEEILSNCSLAKEKLFHYQIYLSLPLFPFLTFSTFFDDVDCLYANFLKIWGSQNYLEIDDALK